MFVPCRRALGLLGLVATVALAQDPQPFVLQTKHFEVIARDKAVADKKAKALEECAGTFTKLFGVAPCRGCVKLLRAGQGSNAFANPGGGGGGGTGSGALPVSWTLDWFNPPPNEPKDPDDLMTHEAAHFMFTEWIGAKFKPKDPPRADRYASKAPDWLHEGNARWHEPEVMKAERRRQVRQAVDQRQHMPFETYFTSEHPLAAELASGRADGAAFKAKEDQLRIYYGQSLAILEFLNAIGGPKVMFGLINDHADGSTTAEILAKFKAPTIRTPQALEAMYLNWVKKNYKAR